MSNGKIRRTHVKKARQIRFSKYWHEEWERSQAQTAAASSHNLEEHRLERMTSSVNALYVDLTLERATRVAGGGLS